MLLPGEKQPSLQLADAVVFTRRRGWHDTVVSQAVATTLETKGGIWLQRDNADQGQASPGRAHSTALLPMSKSNPSRGLVLTLAVPQLLSSYPLFMAVRGAQAPSSLSYI